ncbi:hypothetical protein EHI47_31010 [Rhizobium leguminosarum]|uniref:Uncharacterized protein n=1 Tax=Rhizobium leguminosarum TaxID=384 RepID=A0A444HM80_RHILE|nr:hypothetical protein [Rhizobium leguminosarum bv. viciae]RWX17377.1 hypothetical protein EHI45_06085 [Rhizobium leguminosarum]RWX23339.1 hypothetical protein EHI47_31010 [Rhizobium leguminosarum]TAU51485.1 hypothetical protein ELI43_00900 [Rhizobium leguminosarum]TBC92700.1 hypothetical protein ELH26_00970 [Rhizobium leguminosarum]
MPLIRLPPPTGVEPSVSTRPSDPRSRGEGTCRALSVPTSLSRGTSPLPVFYGERVRVRGKPHGTSSLITCRRKEPQIRHLDPFNQPPVADCQNRIQRGWQCR